MYRWPRRNPEHRRVNRRLVWAEGRANRWALNHSFACVQPSERARYASARSPNQVGISIHNVQTANAHLMNFRLSINRRRR